MTLGAKLRNLVPDILCVLAVIIAAIAVVYIRLQLQYLPGRGPAFDTFALLDNALTMAGKSTYFEIGRPPLMPFLMSLVFRLGFTSETVAYVLDGLSLVLGAAGLYLLLRRSFSYFLAIAGALIFLALPEIVLNVTMGMTDIMAVSLSIWLIYFTIKGITDDRRFTIAILPLFVLTFLTRYTAAVMIFPVLFAMFYQGNLLKQLREWMIGLGISVGILAVDIAYYWHMAGDQALSQFINPFKVAISTPVPSAIVSSGGTTVTRGTSTYFLTTLPAMLGDSWQAWILIICIVVGLGIFAGNLFRQGVRQPGQNKAIVIFLLASSLSLSLLNFNFLLTNAVIVVMFLAFLSNRFELDETSIINIIVFIWLISFFCYHSHQSVKVTRYFLTMAPQVIFFIILGLSAVVQSIRSKSGSRAGVAALAIISIGLFIFSAFTTNRSYDAAVKIGKWGLPEDVAKACDWLRPRLKPGDTVYSDYYVAVAWYLRRPVTVMPIFADNKAVDHELLKYNVEYFVSIWQAKNMPHYNVARKFGGMFVLTPNGKPKPGLPKVLFIGQDLDHYLEDILRFKYYVVRHLSPFADDSTRAIGTTYIDDYTLPELSRYRLITLYNFKWRNQQNAEELLLAYLKQGGTIIIDASGNSGNYLYDLDNGNFLGVPVINDTLTRNTKMTITNAKTISGADIQTDKFAPWVNETGDTWKGSTYLKQVQSGQTSVKSTLAADDDRIVIGTAELGKGKIIWFGYNFFFHSFLYKNQEEQKLIRSVFSTATAGAAK